MRDMMLVLNFFVLMQIFATAVSNYSVVRGQRWFCKDENVKTFEGREASLKANTEKDTALAL